MNDELLHEFPGMLIGAGMSSIFNTIATRP